MVVGVREKLGQKDVSQITAVILSVRRLKIADLGHSPLIKWNSEVQRELKIIIKKFRQAKYEEIDLTATNDLQWCQHFDSAKLLLYTGLLPCVYACIAFQSNF